MSGPLLTARHVAELLDVSAETVLRWTRRGELPAVRLPSGQLRYSAEAIDAWLAERSTVRAEGADEECELPDAPTARRQDTATTLRPVSYPLVPRDESNEED
jgi:excisionase family DNA binding protein